MSEQNISSDEKKRSGWMKRLFLRLNQTMEQNRGGGRSLEATLMAEEAEQIAENTVRRSRNTGNRRVVIPDGVHITGSIVGSADVEIGGLIEGDLKADGSVMILKTGTVGGKINAVSIRVDGEVRGTIHAGEHVMVSGTGIVRAPIQAGGKVEIGGTVEGDITTPDGVRILKTGRVNGNLKMHVLYMEDGGILNGQCMMGIQRRTSDTDDDKK
ncbi:MAG TPA: polymer-forming cytoskeletal protein [Candidatus Hydrogenedentes bacterium]|nr:polymer-forming cytoskeletal protein [Candidatus Hydrogenedentota bacterium]